MGFVTTAAEIMAFLRSKGFTLETRSGRHGTKLVKGKLRIPLPTHPRDMSSGTAIEILRRAGYSKDDLLEWRGR